MSPMHDAPDGPSGASEHGVAATRDTAEVSAPTGAAHLEIIVVPGVFALEPGRGRLALYLVRALLLARRLLPAWRGSRS